LVVSQFEFQLPPGDIARWQALKNPRMDTNPRNLVAAGYDDIADAYLDRFGVSIVRRKWLGRLIESLHSQGSRVLDLGCGAGVPVARELAALDSPSSE
jgi:ubiquinone/menaquinone biosynthesis C-methylase UbiE